MEWRVNIKGPIGTPFEGGLWHIAINFPPKYPNEPPSVKLFTEIPNHPNIIDGLNICLDILDKKEKVQREENKGWTSAYTASSIILQLQSFLFIYNEKQ